MTSKPAIGTSGGRVIALQPGHRPQMQRDRRIETRFGLRGDENSWGGETKKAPQEAVEKRKNADAVAAAAGHMVAEVLASPRQMEPVVRRLRRHFETKKAPQEVIEKRIFVDPALAAARVVAGHVMAALSLMRLEGGATHASWESSQKRTST